jgi:hypothetical protein
MPIPPPVLQGALRDESAIIEALRKLGVIISHVGLLLREHDGHGQGQAEETRLGYSHSPNPAPGGVFVLCSAYARVKEAKLALVARDSMFPSVFRE